MLSFSVRLVSIFSMLVSEFESALSGAVRPERCSPNVSELGEREIQFGVFVGEFVEILGGVLKVFHRVSRFIGNRFDDLQHFRCGLAEIGCCVRLQCLAIFCVARLLRALSEIDCHVA